MEVIDFPKVNGISIAEERLSISSFTSVLSSCNAYMGILPCSTFMFFLPFMVSVGIPSNVIVGGRIAIPGSPLFSLL